jgi:cation diffusion facilitator family transporter
MNRQKEAYKVTFAGFLVNIILTVFKLLAGFLGNSSAMIADGIHSMSDFGSDIMVFFGFKISNKPADDNHNYGHERFETLTSFVISIMLIGVGIGISFSSVDKIINIINGEVIEVPGLIAFFAALISIISKEWIYRYTLKVGKKIKSKAIIANAWHHRTDSFSSIGALIGIGMAILLGDKFVILDPITALIVTVFIFKAGIEILMQSINEFLDVAIEEKDIKLIEDIIFNTDGVKDFHKLKTRALGNKISVEFHILVDKGLSITKAHEITDILENKLKNEFGDETHINIHIEPYKESEI